ELHEFHGAMMPMTKDQIVVITGSASGIGRATAAGYLARGATVYGLDIAADQDHPAPGATTWMPRCVDVSDVEAVEKELKRIVANHGGVDVLVPSAALGFPESFVKMTAESWDRVFAVNVTGTMACIRAVLPSMVARGSGSV